MKQLILKYIPPKLFVLLKGWGWSGNYKSWQEAEKKSKGYNAPNILECVKTATLKVKNGEAIYERDSVLFDKIEYSWELLTALLWVAAQKNGELNIIDFGGSLGSTYYQNKQFLDRLKKVRWNVVEQSDFAEVGKETFQNEVLHFYDTIKNCYKATSEIDVILFSGVLQYLEYPYDTLKEAIEKNVKYIIIDRTGFTLKKDRQNGDKITIQKVPQHIYKASYPCRFFNESRFVKFFNDNGYKLIVDFNALDKINYPSKYKGFVLERV
ncbi:MAG: methyltransferase, TIGR04325 family [Bacteroidales bacterium]|jgi:putative methyltransferase (TIGR04325 family)|nr:methyltransferase, TIGR04325 family [Bacteroidales bacterium]